MPTLALHFKMAAKFFQILSFVLLAGLVTSATDNSLVPPEILIKIFQKCTKNNAVLDPAILGTTKECLEPTVQRAHETDPEGERPIETFCEYLPEVAKCYEPMFELAEKCIPEWVGHENIFQPKEIVKNVQKALCVEDKPQRVKDVLMLGQDGLSAALCFAMHRDAILKDFKDTKVAKKLYKDPFQIFSEDTCEILDKIEDTLIGALDLCEQADVVTKFSRRLFDVLGGIIFKCEAHENF